MRIFGTCPPPSMLTAFLVLSSLPWTIHGQSQSQRINSSSSINHAEEQAEKVRRSLLSFREVVGNTSFDCFPSGPCLACQYSEKNDEKYRCSETGYRIPLKCVETGDGSKKENNKKFQKRRSLLEDGHEFNSLFHPQMHIALRHLKLRRLLELSFTIDGGKKTYITYRSCVPPVPEERLTVLGFEGILFCLLLVGGTIVYFRRKHTVPMSGVGAARIPTNSRF